MNNHVSLLALSSGRPCLQLFSKILAFFITCIITQKSSAQCGSNSVFSDDYSNASNWTVLGNTVLAPPNGSVSPGSVQIAGGVIVYNNFRPRQTYRLTRSLSGALSNNQNQFRVEFDFTITSINVDIAVLLLGITQNNSHPYTDNSGTTIETNNNGIEVRIVNPLFTYTGYNVYITSKYANTRGLSSNSIPLNSNVHYWARMQRLNARIASLQVYSDAGRTSLVGETCVRIDPAINGLNYIQHGGVPSAGWSRVTQLTQDNLCVYPNILGDSCSLCPSLRDTVTNNIDTLICNGGAMVLTASQTNASTTHLWNTGSTDKKITISSEGTYSVLSVNKCKYNIDNFNISAVNVTAEISNNNKDSIICAGDTVILSGLVSPANASILWSTGDKISTTQVTAAGRYTLFAEYTGCKVSDHIDMVNYPVISIDLGSDTTICADQTLILPQIATSGPADKYKWQDGSSGRSFEVTESGEYYVEVSNECTSIIDTVTITTRLCKLYFPSGFTPNGDGNNDIARLGGDITNVSNFELHIYNRRGQEVFESTDVNIGWNGMFKGEPAALATYYYYIKFRYNGEDEFLKGSLILVR